MVLLSLKDVAEYIVIRLKEEGFSVLYYESFSSNSIYIKMDYGVCNSIRISDHHSRKKHLHYRYNVVTSVSHKHCKDNSRHPRWFYPTWDAETLVRDIVNCRRDKVIKYGIKYKHYVTRSKIDHAHCGGFWEHSVEK